jgi:ABC-type multidrug transport system ATPase subunit
MLVIQKVTKRFSNGVTAVKDFSLTLDRGILGLLGPNGAGKTTLMQMVATITRPTSGTISFDGNDIVRDPDAIRRRLGFLPQDFGAYDNLTAFEFLSFIGALKGVHNRARVLELLELVNLHTEAHRPAATFSGGMRQRLGIAQALLNNPDILIVDEPTAGLDPEERVRFRNILSEIGRGKLVILSTHIVTDVEAVATHLAVMNKGRLVNFSTPEELLRMTMGSVWEVVIASQEFETFRSRYKISRTMNRLDGLHVRVIHPTAPAEHATQVEPDLEEAFIRAIYSAGSLED